MQGFALYGLFGDRRSQALGPVGIVRNRSQRVGAEDQIWRNDLVPSLVRYNGCAIRFQTTTYDHTPMPALFHPLLALIASATDRELAKHVEYLKEENKILRARIPGEIHTRAAERERLLKYGMKIGRAIEELITIVTPGTFYRWVRDAKNGRPKIKNPKGGQRKPKEIRELVIQIATVTGFGYTRIIGELRKLGIKKISRQTVRNILKEVGIRPGPDR